MKPITTEEMDAVRAESKGNVSQINVKEKPIALPKGVFVLPNDHVSYTESAEHIFRQIARRKTMFMFGSAVVEIDRRGGELSVMNPEKLRSRMDSYGNKVMHYIVYKDDILLKPKRCSKDIASVLMNTCEIKDILPEIRVVTDAPVITKDGILKKGYHDCGVLVRGGGADEVPIKEAIPALINIFRDFDFQTPSDFSRAMAMLITPALKVGKLITDPTPADIAEADHSQSGKTFRQEIIRMIYGEKAHLITKKTGGVGSLDESIGAGLMSGKPFISFDNVRGLMDSQFLEAIITWREDVSVRLPHKGEFNVDATGVTIQMSSNGVETTRDMANRSCIVRICKQNEGYKWFEWEEGTLSDHIKARQQYYLGCVFSVVKEWIEFGMKQTDTVEHDMRPWAQKLDWIVRNVMGLDPIMNGHQSIQRRVSEPHMGWLRNVCISIHGSLRLGEQLQAGQIADICEDDAIEWPNNNTPRDEYAAKLSIGRIFGKLFKDAESEIIEVDRYRVKREITEEYSATRRETMRIKHYSVEVMPGA